MKSYVVLLNLTYAEETYSGLISYLKSGIGWARPMPGTWIIRTTLSAIELRNGIKSNINPLDKVCILGYNEPDWATHNIEKDVSDWLNNTPTM